MKKVVLFTLFLGTTIVGFGQSNLLPNRDSFALTLAIDSVGYFEMEVESSPYILPENTIQLYPGEKILVEVELQHKKIKSIKTVKENLKPKITLEIEFMQHTTGITHDLMMLKVKNPFDQKLVYKAQIYLMRKDRWVPTSVLPVGKKMDSYETWPDIISTIALSGWEFK